MDDKSTQTLPREAEVQLLLWPWKTIACLGRVRDAHFPEE
jgi:hypothetical protein